MLSVPEAAKVLKVAAVSVRLWARQGRFPGAKREETPAGPYWLLPESSLVGFEMGKAGRPKKGNKAE